MTSTTLTSPPVAQSQARPLGMGKGEKPVSVILFATDLSVRSDRACERAVQLAKTHGARLVIFHGFDEELPASLHEHVGKAAREEISDLLAKIPAAADITVEIDIVAGRDYLSIIEAGERADADLMVMGVHRNESGRKPFLGTTLERVIRNGRRPVLVVPNVVKGAYKSTMVGVDFSVFSRFAIRGGMALCPDSDFHMVHAFRVPFAGFQHGDRTRSEEGEAHAAELAQMIDEEMAALLDTASDEASPAKIERINRHGDAIAVLREEVDRVRPDLLVLGTHGRVGLGHAVLGSVAEAFLNLPPCDVLVVKAW